MNHLEEVITEFHKYPIPPLFKRELSIPADTDKVITLIGLRRTGKTYYLFQIIQQLLNEGLDKKRIFYINFEDERLSELTTSDLSTIIELYYKINPGSDILYLFLDEIQEIDGWELFIRRLIEKKIARNIPDRLILKTTIQRNSHQPEMADIIV